MKNKSIFKLLPLFTICLASCSNTNAIIVPKNLDVIVGENALYYEVSTSSLLNLFNNKSTFVLYFYSPNCGICSDVSSYLNNEILNKSNSVIYKYNVVDNYNSYTLLSDFNEHYFPRDYISTPRIFFVKEGIITTEMNSSKFNNKNLFTSTFNSFVKCKNNLYSFANLTSYNYFISNYNNFTAISYNSSEMQSLTLFNNEIYSRLIQNKSNNFYFIFDTAFMTEEDKNSIKEDLNIEDLDNIFFYKEKHAYNYIDVLDNFNTLISGISPQL